MTDPDTRAFLAIDAGNTTVVVGLFRGETLEDSWRLSSQTSRTGDEIALTLRGLLGDHVDDVRAGGHVGIASVVPQLTVHLERATERLFGRRAFRVTADSDLGIPVRYQDPSQIGPDRLCNAVAVGAEHGRPAIVVDLGTTTNFDVVAEDGAFEGGTIAPGYFSSAEELFRRAARLPRVELGAPRSAIGRTTEEAIRSGIVYGTVGQIDGIVRRIASEMSAQPIVVATGGLAEAVFQASETIDRVDLALTLKGIRRVAEAAPPA